MWHGAPMGAKHDIAAAASSAAGMASRACALAGDVGRGLLELAWPTRCVICDLPGSLLCEDCRDELPLIDQRDACPACGAPYGRIACTECWTREGLVEHPFSEAACAAEFDGPAARLAVAYKDQGERRLASLIAVLIAEAAEARWGVGSGGDGGCGRGCDSGDKRLWVPEAIVPIPATRQAIRRRGFDHILPVTERLGERWDLPVDDVLAKADAVDQRELGRAGRIENMGGAFSLRGSSLRIPCTVLLVDDVFTTGATLSAATSLLLDAGAEEVRVATLCRVW